MDWTSSTTLGMFSTMSTNVLSDHATRPFNPATFRAPPAICRGTPFWSWNGRLDRARLFRQLALLKEMGMGGAHVHPRTGLSAPDYLSPEFLTLVRDCADEAKRTGIYLWLYDEDRWPSGFAGGLVTKDPALRCRHLRLTRTPCAPGETRNANYHHSAPLPTTDREWVAGWGLQFDAEGRLTTVRRLAAGETAAPGETGWYAYREISISTSWFNNQAYADLLNPKAVARFIEVTHERYAQALGDRLGSTVPAIFTDEPLFRGMPQLASASDDRDQFLAWTDDLPQSFRAATAQDIFDVLPGVFFDRADGISSRDRWVFHDHHTERFAGYADAIGAWCERHGIAATGHLMAEENLGSQTEWVGECMRSYRGFQLPGIDLLCDSLEYTTAKQAQSVARQSGRPGLLSELYGVTNWDFDFQGHKRQGDWQAALGIIVRVHHLAWYSMAGEAKRDYPAAIGWQSPWWREYPAVEDHYARLNTVLTRGRPRCRVAVVHPIESFWVERGPHDRHCDEAAAQEAAFSNTVRWLLHGLIDFDFISESLLPSQSQVAATPALQVGKMAYDVVVLPRLRTIRATTLDRLEAFVAAGGTVIFAGGVPALVDAVPSDRGRRLALRCVAVGLDSAELLSALAPWREIDVRHGGGRAGELVHQLREEGDLRWLFIANTNRANGGGDTVRIRGSWGVEALDTSTGAIRAVASVIRAGWTEIPTWIEAAGHLLYRLSPAQAGAPAVIVAPTVRWTEHHRLAAPEGFSLDEPNVLLLDRAAWRVDGGAWQAEDELLRADNLAREAVGRPHRHGEIAQPWCKPPVPTGHRVAIAFTIVTDLAVRSPRLALERPEVAALRLDGTALAVRDVGHWIDEDIRTVSLPDLAAGTHRLEIEWPLDEQAGLEWCYLLGDFGVQTTGRSARIVASPQTLAWGDWTSQGLPFYGGNVTYRSRLDSPGGRLRLAVPRFRAPLLAVDLDGKRAGRIAFAPWRLDLGTVVAGSHELALTAFGSRINTCGQIHNSVANYHWWGPASFRTWGDQWSDEYVLRPQGILTAPQVETGT